MDVREVFREWHTMLDRLVSTGQTAKLTADLHPSQKPTRSCRRLPIVMEWTLSLVSDAPVDLGSKIRMNYPCTRAITK